MASTPEAAVRVEDGPPRADGYDRIGPKPSCRKDPAVRVRDAAGDRSRGDRRDFHRHRPPGPDRPGRRTRPIWRRCKADSACLFRAWRSLLVGGRGLGGVIPNDQDRARRVLEDVPSDTSENESSQAGPSVSAHDDESALNAPAAARSPSRRLPPVDPLPRSGQRLAAPTPSPARARRAACGRRRRRRRRWHHLGRTSLGEAGPPGTSTSATLTTRTSEPAKMGEVRSRSAARLAHDEPSQPGPRASSGRVGRRAPALASGPRLRRTPNPATSTRSSRGPGSRRRPGRPACARSIDDGSRRATAEDVRVDGQAGSGQPFSGLVNGPVSLGSDSLPRFHRSGPSRGRPWATEQACTRLDRVRHEDLGSRRPGDVGDEVDTKRCRLGPVNGDENSHRSPSISLFWARHPVRGTASDVA